VQKKRWWLPLREKDGKLNEMRCHHNLEEYLDAYIEAAGTGVTCGAWCAAAPPMRASRRLSAATPFAPMPGGGLCRVELN
jgi:hypothetical protein